jgi:hypothetical protein
VIKNPNIGIDEAFKLTLSGVHYSKYTTDTKLVDVGVLRPFARTLSDLNEYGITLY